MNTCISIIVLFYHYKNANCHSIIKGPTLLVNFLYISQLNYCRGSEGLVFCYSLM